MHLWPLPPTPPCTRYPNVSHAPCPPNRLRLRLQLSTGNDCPVVQGLAADFPRGDAVIQLAALAHYSLQNFEEAQELFEELLRRDPHRIEVGDVPCCAALFRAVLCCAGGRLPCRRPLAGLGRP